MGKDQESDSATRIIAVVLDLLAADGYEAVQLRTVAARAHVSLAKIYKLFHTRDELILVALEQWMAEHTYADIAPAPPGEPVGDALIRVLRCVFEPWERYPTMLESYHYARSGPGGHRLDAQGLSFILPIAEQVLADLDPDYIEDVAIILTNMVLALIARFATGTLEITGILPILERTVHRLTTDNTTVTRPRTTTSDAGRVTRSLANVSDSLERIGVEAARTSHPDS